jgi:hypothetical protein
MSCPLGLISCCFCDLLCMECNCLIFPRPECSYRMEIGSVSAKSSKEYKFFCNVSMVSLRMIEEFLIWKYQRLKADSQKNAAFIFTATQKTSD